MLKSKPNLKLIPGGLGATNVWVPQPRTRLPVWRWLTLAGELVALTVGAFVVTAVVSMLLATVVAN